jgi:hypothetical protein
MLMTEWKLEDALEVQYREGREEGLERGLEKVARNALAEGMSPDLVSRITGLDTTTIKRLAGR